MKSDSLQRRSPTKAQAQSTVNLSKLMNPDMNRSRTGKIFSVSHMVPASSVKQLEGTAEKFQVVSAASKLAQ